MDKRIGANFIIILMFVLVAGCTCQAKKQQTTQEVNRETTSGSFTVEQLTGSWLDTSPAALHFTLHANGTAQSDNMHTLLYSHWRLNGNQLILTVESMGNGASSSSDEIWVLKELSVNKLVAQKGEMEMVYVRKQTQEK